MPAHDTPPAPASPRPTTLHGYFRSASAWRVRIALGLKGVPVAQVAHHLRRGEQRAPDYLRLNPKGRVPVLVDGDFVLTEAAAILRYVSLLAPDKGLWPSDPREDARCAEWLAWCASGVHVAYAHVRRTERYASSEAGRAEVEAKGRETTRETWQLVEQRFAAQGTPWAAGSSFSVADMRLSCMWARPS